MCNAILFFFSFSFYCQPALPPFCLVCSKTYSAGTHISNNDLIGHHMGVKYTRKRNKSSESEIITLSNDIPIPVVSIPILFCVSFGFIINIRYHIAKYSRRRRHRHENTEASSKFATVVPLPPLPLLCYLYL